MSSLMRTFWPDADALPVRRIVMAFLFSPLIIGAVIVLMAFLIAGMTEPTGAGVIAVTMSAAKALIPMLFAFLLTFGMSGILALWFLKQRGVLAWAVCGALMGAVSSALLGELMMSRVERPLLIASAIGGWTMFLLFRWIAGIRDAASDSDAANQDQTP